MTDTERSDNARKYTVEAVEQGFIVEAIGTLRAATRTEISTSGSCRRHAR